MDTFARFMRTTGKLRFFLPLGLILIALGIVVLVVTPKNLVEGTGVVTAVESVTEDEPDGVIRERFEVRFTYTVDGKEYTGEFTLDEAPGIGSAVTVYYDPAKPETVANAKDMGVFGIGMIVVGVISAAFAVLSTVKSVKKNRRIDAQTTTAPVAPLPKEQLTEYYVSHDGNTLKPGYIVEDGARKVIFEAPMTKQAMVGDRVFTFTDHTTGRSVEHRVGHTVTSGFSDEMFSTTSSFKFDGQNVWDVIHSRGVRISTDLFSGLPKKVTYTLSRGGRFFATVETAGKYVHEEDAEAHAVNIPVGRYYYRVWTRESDWETLFLTIFAISETEQPFVE